MILAMTHLKRKYIRYLLAAGIGILALVILLGQSGRIVHEADFTSANPRELPIYSVETTENRVALGINCAWDDKDIDSILQTLAEKDVKATFFLVGNWCGQYPDAALKIAAAGHEIGSHSQTHPDMTKLSREEIERQLNDSKACIEKVTGKEIRLFRPPSGAYNNLTVSTARALGWEVVQWDCDTLDWKGGETPEIVQNGTKKLQNGSILLLHAGTKHTAEALPALIDTIREQGFNLTPVGRLLYLPPYAIDHTGRQHRTP